MTSPIPSRAGTKLANDKPSVRKGAKLDTERMLLEINEIVSGDWAYSVTDDMVRFVHDNHGTEFEEFTQKQAEEMSRAIGRVYMIAHAIKCNACASNYVKRVGSEVPTGKRTTGLKGTSTPTPVNLNQESE